MPFLILGNKVDVDESQRKISNLEAKNLCQQNGDMLFYETSAKSNINVEDAFRELIVRVMKRQDDMAKILGDFSKGGGVAAGRASAAGNSMNKR